MTEELLSRIHTRLRELGYPPAEKSSGFTIPTEVMRMQDPIIEELLLEWEEPRSNTSS